MTVGLQIFCCFDFVIGKIFNKNFTQFLEKIRYWSRLPKIGVNLFAAMKICEADEK